MPLFSERSASRAAAISAGLAAALSASARADDHNAQFMNFALKSGHVSQSRLFLLPDAGGEPFAEIDGVSTLVRRTDGVGYVINTRDLKPGAAYTNWFVAFNRPDQCNQRCACGEDDLTNPFAEVGVFYAAGQVADAYGQATFAGETGYGELPDGFDQVPFAALNAPISPRAEIHLVVRTHNAVSDDLELRESQLSTFNQGCGREGCADIQAAIHRSPFCAKRRGGRRHHDGASPR